MSHVTRDNVIVPTAKKDSSAWAVYQNWGAQVQGPAKGTREIEYVRAVNKRPYVAYVYSRWTEASTGITVVLEGPIKIFPGDSYDFAINLKLTGADVFEMRTDQHDSCDTTAVWTDYPA